MNREAKRRARQRRSKREGDQRRREIAEALHGKEPLTYEQTREFHRLLGDSVQEWQGIPVLLDDPRLRVHDRHPLRRFYQSQQGPDVRVLVSDHGPEDAVVERRDGEEDVEWAQRLVTDRIENERIRNHWFSYRLHADVYVIERLDTGRIFAVKIPVSPDLSMDRLDLWLRTIGASDAWDEKAEEKARRKLRSLVTERQWRHYTLTGSFLEVSERTDLHYLFRRLRPTVVMTSHGDKRMDRTGDERMRTLAVLCLHPIGYYQGSWGGAMVPTDDVIAHLLMMRSDEAYYWRCANQHRSWRPEAGL